MSVVYLSIIKTAEIGLLLILNGTIIVGGVAFCRCLKNKKHLAMAFIFELIAITLLVWLIMFYGGIRSLK
jgi:hypothetical protein